MFLTKRSNTIHPFLFTALPVLFLFSQNVNLVRLKEAVVILALSLAATGAIFLAVKLFFRDEKKIAVAISWLVILFFSYGYFKDALDAAGFAEFWFTRHRYLILSWVVLGAAGSYFIAKSRKNFSGLNLIFNFTAVILSAVFLVSLFLLSSQKSRNISPIEISSGAVFPEAVKNGKADLPDIYFIIPDSYASSEVLKKYFNYSNEEFTSYLRGKGFAIAQNSRSSYATTFLLAASTYNMQYLDFLRDGLGADSQNYDPLIQMIENNKVTRLFKAAGYKYVHISTSDVVYGLKKGADYEFTGARIDDLYRQVLLMTILRSFIEEFKHTRQTVLDVFAKLKQMPEMDFGGPKFILTHIMSPHQPYFFGPDGEERDIDRKDLNGQERMRYYLDQLKYENKMIKEAVDQILEKSKKPPVIIIQSDNGFYLPEEIYGENATRSNELKNFSAYYLPGRNLNELPQNMVTANTFRFIFDRYLGTKLGLLEAHSYSSFTGDPYNFKEFPF